MGDDKGALIVGVLAGIIFASIVWYACSSLEIDRYQQAAIERGYAHHNPETGDWEWIEPEQKEGGE
jgi:hypothetical protein